MSAEINRLRVLAERWAKGAASFDIDTLDEWERPEEMSDAELDELLAGVRDEMAREVERRAKAAMRALKIASQLGLGLGWRDDADRLALVQREERSQGRQAWDGLADNHREALAYHVAQLLGEDFTADHDGPFGVAWSLCEAAGWPS